MSDPQEPKNLVLERLNQVMAEVQAMRAENKQMHENLHDDMRQIKARMTALEKQMAITNESVVAQWDTFDKHENRLRSLETQS
jgi:peptidoglycan hydrolase CwlO-like protein